MNFLYHTQQQWKTMFSSFFGFCCFVYFFPLFWNNAPSDNIIVLNLNVKLCNRVQKTENRTIENWVFALFCLLLQFSLSVHHVQLYFLLSIPKKKLLCNCETDRKSIYVKHTIVTVDAVIVYPSYITNFYQIDFISRIFIYNDVLLHKIPV